MRSARVSRNFTEPTLGDGKSDVLGEDLRQRPSAGRGVVRRDQSECAVHCGLKQGVVTLHEEVCWLSVSVLFALAAREEAAQEVVADRVDTHAEQQERCADRGVGAVDACCRVARRSMWGVRRDERRLKPEATTPGHAVAALSGAGHEQVLW